MRNFQDAFQTQKGSFINAFLIYVTVPLRYFIVSECLERHISDVSQGNISKSKRYYNVKSLAHYAHEELQICISLHYKGSSEDYNYIL